MITLTLSRGSGSIKGREKHNLRDANYSELNELLKNEIKIGTTIRVKSDNVKVEKHRGKYYLLYVEEIGTAYLFYQDVKGVLRTVYTGNIETVLYAVYNNIADDTDLVILNGRGKKAYRCVRYVMIEGKRCLKPINIMYKNKSSKVNPQVYLGLYEAIMNAAHIARENKETIGVITARNTILMEINII